MSQFFDMVSMRGLIMKSCENVIMDYVCSHGKEIIGSSDNLLEIRLSVPELKMFRENESELYYIHSIVVCYNRFAKAHQLGIRFTQQDCMDWDDDYNDLSSVSYCLALSDLTENEINAILKHLHKLSGE